MQSILCTVRFVLLATVIGIQPFLATEAIIVCTALLGTLSWYCGQKQAEKAFYAGVQEGVKTAYEIVAEHARQPTLPMPRKTLDLRRVDAQYQPSMDQ